VAEKAFKVARDLQGLMLMPQGFLGLSAVA
jgi:hypothetical protein